MALDQVKKEAERVRLAGARESSVSKSTASTTSSVAAGAYAMRITSTKFVLPNLNLKVHGLILLFFFAKHLNIWWLCRIWYEQNAQLFSEAVQDQSQKQGQLSPMLFWYGWQLMTHLQVEAQINKTIAKHSVHLLEAINEMSAESGSLSFSASLTTTWATLFQVFTFNFQTERQDCQSVGRRGCHQITHER